MKRKNKIILLSTIIFLILVTLILITYGYYLTKIKGNTNDNSVTVSLAYLELTYNDGNGLISANNIIPGENITTKTFSVENTGNKKVVNYVVYLEDVINTFEDKNDLKLTLNCTSSINNSCGEINTIYPDKDTLLVLNDIEVGEIQTYELKVDFIETYDDQSDNMNKIIEGNIVIKDIKDIKETVSGTDNVMLDNPKQITDYKIYGNSVQDGTPTPDTPVEIQSVGDKTKNICPGFNYNYPSDGEMATYKFPVKANTYYSIHFDSTQNAYKTVWLYDTDNNISQLINYAYQNTNYNKMVVLPKQDGYMSIGIVNKNAKVIVAEGLYYTLNTTQTNNLNNNKITTSVSGGTLDYEPYNKYKIPITRRSKNLADFPDFTISSNLQNVNPNGISKIFNKLGTFTFSTYIDNTEGTENAFVRLSLHKNGAWTYNYTNYIYAGTKGWATYTFTLDNTYNNSFNFQFSGTANKTAFSNIMLEYGNERTILEPYYAPDFEVIYLDEPLRKIGDYADYIDFKNQKVVRNVKVLDDAGTLPIGESYQGLSTPTEETIDLPTISTNEGTNIIEVDTTVSPSKIDIEYLK